MKRLIYILTLLLFATNLFSQSTKRVIKKDELNEPAYQMLSSAMDTLQLIEWIECENFGQGAKAVDQKNDTIVVFYAAKSMSQRPHLDFYYQVDISILADWIQDDLSKVNSNNEVVRAFESKSRRFKFYIEVDSQPEKKIYKFTYN